MEKPTEKPVYLNVAHQLYEESMAREGKAQRVTQRMIDAYNMALHEHKYWVTHLEEHEPNTESGTGVVRSGFLQWMPGLHWYLDGLVPKARTTVLAGNPASGKSQLAWEWAIFGANANGRRYPTDPFGYMVDVGPMEGKPGIVWGDTQKERGGANVPLPRHTGGPNGGLGVRVSPTTGRVLYLVTEGRSGFRDRARATALAYPGIDPFPDNLHITTTGVRLDAETTTFLKEANEKMQYDMIVFDTLINTFDGDSENDSLAMANYMDCVQFIRDGGSDTAALVVHHLNKGGGVRGSTALTAAADVEIRMERKEGEPTTTVKAGKIKDGGELFDPWKFVVDFVDLGSKEPSGKQRRAGVIRVVGDSVIRRDPGGRPSKYDDPQEAYYLKVEESPGLSHTAIRKALGGDPGPWAGVRDLLVEQGRVYTEDGRLYAATPPVALEEEE